MLPPRGDEWTLSWLRDCRPSGRRDNAAKSSAERAASRFRPARQFLRRSGLRRRLFQSQRQDHQARPNRPAGDGQGSRGGSACLLLLRIQAGRPSSRPGGGRNDRHSRRDQEGDQRRTLRLRAKKSARDLLSRERRCGRQTHPAKDGAAKIDASHLRHSAFCLTSPLFSMSSPFRVRIPTLLRSDMT